MAHIHKSPPTFDGYIIQSCTNTGVWMVQQQDIQSGQPIAIYDFVNREYSMAQPEAEPLTIDLMTEPEKAQFLTLQRNLNKALLNEGKS
jgi:hypothetical protein